MGYEKSKIYKLQHEDGHFYIGSTYATLRGRLQKHKEKAIKVPERRVYKHIHNEWDKVRILLIEEFSCESKYQLLKREDEYIQKELKNPLCLNTIGAVLNVEQRLEYNRNYNPIYYEEKREEIREKQRQYYLANREKLIQKNREYKKSKKTI
jgi:predicted GIY-YIG superfamily endonuclease